MTGEIPDLRGVWHSRFEYGDGLHSEHTVDLRQSGLKVNGSSRLDDTGSELFLDLWLREDEEGDALEGFWEEKTSPRGTYKGQVFRGVLGLLLSEPDKASGYWIGPNRDRTEENIGKLTLQREVEEDVGKEE